MKIILSATATFGVLGLAVSSGVWLLSQTDYPFTRTVGGATLVFLAVGVIAGALANADIDW